MWSGKFMARSGIKGYNVLLTGDTKNLEDKTKEKEVSDLKFLNKTAYNELIPAE